LTRRGIVAAVSGLVLLAGCGGSDDDDTGSGATSPATTAKRAPAGAKPAKPGETVAVGSTTNGRILVDDRNVPLYLFTKDGRGPSECSGECAAEWPPLLTKGVPRAGKGARAALLGTVKRSDGALQVTYDGRPLYHYVDDSPGQVRCQAVFEFGGYWYIVAGSGRAITTK
jgi:predicted lipoprotein with Yx(FWY)xxD motif